MKIRFSKTFTKQRDKAPIKIQQTIDDRIKLFIEDPSNQLLNLHKLKGVLRKYHSINISGDWRAIIRITEKEVALFMFLGTHS